MKTEKKSLAIRCPNDILARLQRAAAEINVSRNAFIVEALRLFSREVRRRGGFVVPPYHPKKTM